MQSDLVSQGHTADVVNLADMSGYGITNLPIAINSGSQIDGGLILFGHGAAGGLSLSPRSGDNIQSELVHLFDFSNLGPDAFIDIRSCNSGTDDTNGVSSVAVRIAVV